ncbi:hypothetical protein [uncultured Sneathiella sp.]|uniref:hypothetical protein n=1 Tax=uncultured Sneathiella sp. TaxID=879315 RepID=UPI0030EBACBE
MEKLADAIQREWWGAPFMLIGSNMLLYMGLNPAEVWPENSWLVHLIWRINGLGGGVPALFYAGWLMAWQIQPERGTENIYPAITRCVTAYLTMALSIRFQMWL